MLRYKQKGSKQFIGQLREREWEGYDKEPFIYFSFTTRRWEQDKADSQIGDH